MRIQHASVLLYTLRSSSASHNGRSQGHNMCSHYFSQRLYMMCPDLSYCGYALKVAETRHNQRPTCTSHVHTWSRPASACPPPNGKWPYLQSSDRLDCKYAAFCHLALHNCRISSLRTLCGAINKILYLFICFMFLYPSVSFFTVIVPHLVISCICICILPSYTLLYLTLFHPHFLFTLAAAVARMVVVGAAHLAEAAAPAAPEQPPR